MKFLSEDGLARVGGIIQNKYVQKEDGKGLSENDYTDADKTKVDGAVNSSDVESAIEESLEGYLKSEDIEAITNAEIDSILA